MPGPMSGGIVDQTNGPLGTQGSSPAPPQTQSVQLPAQVDPNTTAAQQALGGAYNAQNAPNAPQPQAPVINPVLAHAAKTGMGWHALMGSHGEVGPNGTVTQAPNKPGDLFRSILAGAIMGASTGAQARMGGGVGSFAVGAGAAQQQAEQQKDKLQQQSQQQFQNQQAQTKENREKTLADAQLAQMQAQTARWNHENDLHDKEAHDLHNKASEALVSALTDPKVGGHEPTDGTLPGTLTASELAQKYMANPKVRFSSNPDVEQRHFIDTSDASEVNWSEGANNGKGGWVEADGTPVNMTDKTTFRVIDVPRDTQNQKIPASGKELNSLSGLPAGSKIYDDDKMYPVSVLDKKAIYQNGEDRRLEQSKVDVENRRLGASERANNLEADRQRHAEFDAQRAPIAAKKESLQAQLKALDNDLAATPADKQALKDQIAEQDQSLQDLADQEYPKTGKGKKAEAKTKETPISVTFNGQVGVFPTQAAADAFIKAHPGSQISGSSAAPTYAPTDKILVKRPDGTTTTTTKSEYDRTLSENPGIKMTIVGKVPETPQQTPAQTMAGLNLTATQ